MTRKWLGFAILVVAACSGDDTDNGSGPGGTAGGGGAAGAAGQGTGGGGAAGSAGSAAGAGGSSAGAAGSAGNSSGCAAVAGCTISGNSFYVDPANGNDTNTGSSTAPWKTLDHALGSVSALDGILLRSGNYGAFQYAGAGFADWVTIKADDGATPVFDSLTIRNPDQRISARLRLCNLTVRQPEPNPWPADDGMRHPLGYMLTIQQADYVAVMGCTLVGVNKYLSNGITVASSDNVTLEHNDVSVVNDGFQVTAGNDMVFSYNHVHGMSEGSGIRFQGEMSNVTIVGNHVHDCNYNESDPYLPSDDVNEWHVGSGISLRIANATIRNNIIHDGFTQGMMFYGDNGVVYSNMLVENNLFYDTGRVALYDVGDNVVVRNNTFVTSVNKEGTGKYDITQRYLTDFTMEYADGYNGSSLQFWNNVFVGMWNLPVMTDPFTEDYNIFWRHSEGDTNFAGGKGQHSRVAVWIGEAPDYTLHGHPNFFEDIGFQESTPEYSYATDGIQAFFVDPGFFFGDVRGTDRHLTKDYHLAEGSPAINAGDATQQPPDSLGSLDGCGFIQKDGAARDAAHHSAGAYER